MKSSPVPIDKALVRLKQYFDCPICCNSIDKPIQTQCGHVFCEDCLNEIRRSSNQPACPLCKAKIVSRALVERHDIKDLRDIFGRLNDVFAEELQKYNNAKERALKEQRKHLTPLPGSARRKRKSSSSIQPEQTIDLVSDGSDKEESRKSGKEKEQTTSKKTSQQKGKRGKRGEEEEKLNQEEKENQAEKRTKESAGTEKKDSQKKQQEVENLGSLQEKEVEKLSARRVESGKETSDVNSCSREEEEIKQNNSKKEEGFGKEEVGKISSERKSNQFCTIEQNGDPITENNSDNPIVTSTMNGPLDLSLPTKSLTKYVCRQAIRFVKPIDLSMKTGTQKAEQESVSAVPAFPSIPSYVPRKKAKNDSAASSLASKDSSEPIVSSTPEPQTTKDGNNDGFEKEGSVELFGSGEKITSSDEVFCTISEEAIIPLTNTRLGRKAATVNKPQKKEESPFKQPQPPLRMISQPGTKKESKKSKAEVKKVIDPMPLPDSDDEFQRPRDSDLLFLEVNEGNNSGDESKSDLVEDSGASIEKTTANFPVSPGEKENVAALRDYDYVMPKKSPARPKGRGRHPSKSPGKSKVITEKHQTEDGPYDWMDEDFEMDDGIMSPKTSRKETIPEGKTVKQQAVVDPLQKKKYVFCPTRLNKAQMAKLQQLSDMCDGSITKDYTHDTTHLVINLCKGRVPQTLKYLLAIANRKWVVIYDWVEECVKAGTVVSEAKFETSNFKTCDSGVKRSRESKTNLFDNFKFYFATDHFENMGFKLEEVLLLMKTLGAEVVQSPHNVKGGLIIIGDTNGNTTEYYDWLTTNQWITVTFQWIIDCILEYQLIPFTNDYLCVEVSDPELEAASLPESMRICISQYITQKSQGLF